MKRLVVCLDGTWNAPDNGDAPTNVVKIMRAVRPSATDAQGGTVNQVVFYDPGVGTGGPIDKFTGGALGLGLDVNVRDGYRFLANNYEPGDEIYLFGFSRGAFTARSLAGFIGRVGLASKARLGTLKVLWDYYRACKPGQPAPPEPAKVTEALQFGHRDVRIRCVGVWDTVGALGVPGEALKGFNRKQFQFHDVTLGQKIDVALHAVAIDEKRGPFAPTLWEPHSQGLGPGQVVEQVWFAGVHSNVGGSYADSGLSDLALEWMIRRVAATTELAFDPAFVAEQVSRTANIRGKLYESRTKLYTVSKMAPFIRLIGQNPVKLSWWRKWIKRMNVRPGGQPYLNEMIHQSAIDRHQAGLGYGPDNLVAALAGDAPHKLPVVGYDGDYPGNPKPPRPPG